MDLDRNDLLAIRDKLQVELLALSRPQALFVLRELLLHQFIWTGTPQGGDYWMGVFRALEDAAKHFETE